MYFIYLLILSHLSYLNYNSFLTCSQAVPLHSYNVRRSPNGQTSAYVEFSGWVFRSNLQEVSMDWYLPLRAGSFCDPSFASVLDRTIEYYELVCIVRILLRNNLGQSLRPKSLANYEDTEGIKSTYRTTRL